MPDLLKIPDKHNTVEDVLGTLSQLNLKSVLVICELEDGEYLKLNSGLTYKESSWLIEWARQKGWMAFFDE